MRSVKGCFFCGKDHRTNRKNTREEVTKDIDKQKQRKREALFTVEDLVFVSDELVRNKEEPEEDEYILMWEEDEEDDEDEEDLLISTATTDLEEIEANLENSAFLQVEMSPMAHMILSRQGAPSRNRTLTGKLTVLESIHTKIRRRPCKRISTKQNASYFG